MIHRSTGLRNDCEIVAPCKLTDLTNNQINKYRCAATQVTLVQATANVPRKHARFTNTIYTAVQSLGLNGENHADRRNQTTNRIAANQPIAISYQPMIVANQKSTLVGYKQQ